VSEALAELEVFHSRPIAPTRRLALGRLQLPFDPPPGPGGVLLGAAAARYSESFDDDLAEDVDLLVRQLSKGMRVVQPRLRHRLQVDRVGLLSSVLRLRSGPDGPSFEFPEQGSPLVYVLGAIYAAASHEGAVRADALEAVGKGLRWQGPIGPNFIAFLGAKADGAAWQAAGQDPVAWALELLGLEVGEERPESVEIKRSFRAALRQAHPDHGGADADAAARIAALTEARRILLG